MFETADPLLVNILIASLAFAVLIIAWQLMRLLGSATEALDELKITSQRINGVISRIENDFEYVGRTVKGVSSTLEKINDEVLNPIRTVSRIFKAGSIFLKTLGDQFRDNTEEDDYIPTK